MTLLRKEVSDMQQSLSIGDGFEVREQDEKPGAILMWRLVSYP
jgi:hypothetical protein